MDPRRLRTVQLGLLGVLALLGVAVTLTLRKPQPAPPSPAATLEPGRTDTTRTGDLTYRIFREGRESLLVKAAEMRGSEQDELLFSDVELTFPYVAQGQPAQGRLTARQCRYTPAIQKAQFRGDVVLRTADGFELRTESLNFRVESGIARGDQPVTFARKSMSGSSNGFVYHAASGTVELLDDVKVRLADPDEPASEITSRRAVLEKDRGSVEFMGDVRGRQGDDTLSAETYYLEFVEDARAVQRGHAYGDVVLTLRGGTQALPGTAPPALDTSGPRVLRAVRLDLWFRPDRTLEETAAGPDAELRLLPGPGQAEGPRTLRARVLVFRFDRQGRLTEVQGQKDSTLVSEPPPGSQAPPLEAACRAFLARLDPASGEVLEIEFQRDVEFSRGTQRGTAGRGIYLAHGVLRLLQSPEARDTARRSRLNAGTIDLHTLTGDLEARDGVRHTLEGAAAEGAAAPGGGLLSARDTATLIVAREFAWDQAKRTSRYTGDVLLRAGSDEVRAGRLTVSETADGKRVFLAEGDVLSRLLAPAAGSGRVTIEARAKTMVFDEGAGKIAYRQDVVLRQERLLTRSPKADLWLTPDGRGLRELVAGEPVELVDGERRVRGLTATYTPADEKVVVTGDDVRLSGPGQEARGRTLTFHLGDDRILVDGRQQSRTETVFRKEPPKP